MPEFGRRSFNEFYTLHPDLQLILKRAIKIYDFSIIGGMRTDEYQKELFDKGLSECDGVKVKSKHQAVRLGDTVHFPKDKIVPFWSSVKRDTLVSMAADLFPYARGHNAFSGKVPDNYRFYFLMGIIEATTKELIKEGLIKHDIRFGLDWDSDHIYSDETFSDLPHIELIQLETNF